MPAKPVSLNSPRCDSVCAAPHPDGCGAATLKSMSEVVKVHTANEVAVLLKVDYKTVLNLIKRGLLKALPGLRHKRISEAELNRYLGVQPATMNLHALTPPVSPAGLDKTTDKSLVSPAAKAVASPVAQSSQRK
jgi:excisionase family DNA binding protein